MIRIIAIFCLLLSISSCTNNEAEMAAARKYVEETEIYLQDGHSLRLKNPQISKCKGCYDFEFEHHGDPGLIYKISVQVGKNGTVKDITRISYGNPK